MEFMQKRDQAIDIAEWHRDEEHEVYPEGARAKTLVYCPSSSNHSYLEEQRKYIFKRSSKRCDEQYWIEVLAYYLGKQMGIDVPLTFVAYDSKKNQAGALSSWFLNSGEEQILGGDYCQYY